jgi:hypothetical protein
MSSSSALKASKSMVESYVSGTEKSDLTTSFTSNSSVSENDSGLSNGIMEKVMIVVKHPKFKWVVIAILLCVCAFIYFKTQKPSKNVKEDTRKDKLDVKLNKNGHPELVEKNKSDKSVKFEFKDKNLQKKLEELDNKQQQQFFTNHMQQMNQQPQMMQPPQHHHTQPHVPQPHHMPPPQQVPKVPQQVPKVPQTVQAPQQVPQVQSIAKDSDSEETESEEVFIENENIMNHNLTMEEMNAIDKQLEDILE